MNVISEGKKTPCTMDMMKETDKKAIEYIKNFLGFLTAQPNHFCPVFLTKAFILVRVFILVRQFFIIDDSPVFKKYTVRIVWASNDVIKKSFRK